MLRPDRFIRSCTGLFSPITDLQPPSIRWPNYLFLVGAWGAIGYAMWCWRQDAAWQRAAMLIAIPMVWVTAGMALIEVPALAFVSFAVAATAWAMRSEQSHRVWAGVLLAGLFLGVAVMGRVRPTFRRSAPSS